MGHAPHVVVMGVSGSGKSTVGGALAERLGLPYADGDDFHPPENVAKMSAGQPLDDADRWPWLESVGRWMAGQERGAVVACSALKRAYRDQLRRHVPGLQVVYLHGSRELIGARQAARENHFMPESLLDSQFAALEPPAADEARVIVDVRLSVEDIVDAAERGLAALRVD